MTSSLSKTSIGELAAQGLIRSASNCLPTSKLPVSEAMPRAAAQRAGGVPGSTQGKCVVLPNSSATVPIRAYLPSQPPSVAIRNASL